MNFTIKKISLFVVIVVHFQVASTEIYRYQDASGKWHYTDDKRKLEQSEDGMNLVEAVDVDTNLNIIASVSDRRQAVVDVPDKLCPSDKSLMSVPRGGHWGKPGDFSVDTKK